MAHNNCCRLNVSAAKAWRCIDFVYIPQCLVEEGNLSASIPDYSRLIRAMQLLETPPPLQCIASSPSLLRPLSLFLPPLNPPVSLMITVSHYLTYSHSSSCYFLYFSLLLSTQVGVVIMTQQQKVYLKPVQSIQSPGYNSDRKLLYCHI